MVILGKQHLMRYKRLTGLAGRFALSPRSSVRGGRYLGALEQHLPDVFVRRVKKLSQHLVLGRVKLPHIECPSLAREDSAEEHDLDHVDKLDFLAYHILDAVLESGQLRWLTPG